nr:luc7-like protein 3 [Ipomoea batatas]GMC98428.1 luc7-like protein 3 [Ipomoea batatas]
MFSSFEKSPRHDSYVPKFEGELAHFCEKLVMDLDRRVRRGRERLDQEDVPPPPPPISAEKSEQLSVLEEKIKNLLEQVESLGEAGQVDEAEALMRKVELLNVEKTALTQQSQQSNVLMMAQEKKMALCETCGSFLIANDAAERTQSHVTGKQHVGYGMVRDFLSEYKIVNMKGPMTGMAEGLVTETGVQIGSTVIPEMEGGIGTENVTEAGHDLLLDPVTGAQQRVQFTNVRGL